MIKASDLAPTTEAKQWYFWKWKDYPRAGGGVPFGEVCQVWEFDLKKKEGAQ